jgi:protein-S-isoprenylcysteine O-methyltransferase Ste14
MGDTVRPARGSWFRVAFTPVAMGAFLFPAAGRLNWYAGWLFIVFMVLVQVQYILVLGRKSPDLLIERDQAIRSGTKPWDRVLLPLIAFVLPVLTWVAAGLSQRYPQTGLFSIPVQVVGFVLMFLSMEITGVAMSANRFFANTVRIQTERGHKVVCTGPYALVRHPGCICMIGFALSSPLALGSRLAYIPSAISLVVFVVRTALEDRTLQAELEGYADYARRVRWRLLPGVW